MSFPAPPNEIERVAALKRYEILDTPPEAVFDGITRSLSAQLDVPIALVSLVDETRQWFKSRYGLGVEETPREIAFCTHAILRDDTMVVPDALKDDRFKDNPLVTGPPCVRFYAGAPLRTRNGYNLGTLSVIDVKPRTLTEGQLRMLNELARVVVEVMELRQRARSVVESERSATRAAEQISWERAEELQTSEKRFHDITSSVPGVVFQFKIDADGRASFPYVGTTIKSIFGLDASDVMDDPETWFRIIHADDRPGLDDSIAETHRTLEPWLWEGRAVLGSGEVGWFRGLSTPRKLGDGSVLWNGFLLDITEMKGAEARLARAQKMEAIGQLTGGVAHDFNNLLAVIMGNAEMLEARESMGDAKQIQLILRAAERGAELTRRLLAFSRQQPLSPKPIDLGTLAAGMRDVLTRTLGEKIDFKVTLADDLWPALADPGQVEEALLNLAINGRDAMPEGGKLTIECANARIDAAFVEKNPESAAGDYVVLAVRDTGAGIKRDMMQHVYEPFFTTKRFGDGFGLGLSMVHGFAKQSGGNITIDSEEGQGTVARLYLPRAKEGFRSE